MEADRKADIGNRDPGVGEQSLGLINPPAQQVGLKCHPGQALEKTAELKRAESEKVRQLPTE